MNEGITKVVFRKFYPEGDVIAIFPEMIGTRYPGSCMSYQHVGQHGACDVFALMDPKRTRPAILREYADLKKELENRGYILKICQRVSRKMHQVRLRRLKEVYR